MQEAQGWRRRLGSEMSLVELPKSDTQCLRVCCLPILAALQVNLQLSGRDLFWFWKSQTHDTKHGLSLVFFHTVRA